MDYSTIEFNYYVVFGRGDCSENQHIEIELTDEEKKAYKKAYEEEIPLEEVDALQDARKRAYIEACEIEMNNLDYSGDIDASEYMGRLEISKEELEARVHSGEKKAIVFLELGGLTEEELRNWTADDLDELPYLCDVDDSYDDINLFDGPYTLKVKFPEEW